MSIEEDKNESLEVNKVEDPFVEYFETKDSENKQVYLDELKLKQEKSTKAEEQHNTTDEDSSEVKSGYIANKEDFERRYPGKKWVSPEEFDDRKSFFVRIDKQKQELEELKA